MGLEGDENIMSLVRGVMAASSFDVYAFAFGNANDFLVAYPEGSGDDYLVAGVDKALHKLVDALLGTSGDNDLFGLEVEVVVAFELLADSLAQVGVTGHRRIVSEVVVDSLFCGLFYHLGGVEVGFTDTEADNVFALSLKLASLCGHSQSLRLGHIENTV